MDKKWCDNLNRETQERINKALKVFDDFVELKKDEYDTSSFWFENYVKYGNIYSLEPYQFMMPHIAKRPVDEEDIEEVIERFNLKESIEILCHYSQFWNLREPYNYYDVYKDGEWVEFDGDIVITDPGYIMKDNHSGIIEYQNTRPGFSILKYNELRDEHFSKSIVSRTLVGDWACGVYLCKGGKQIGSFGADCGLVSVTYLEETNNYNKEWNHIHESAYTIIPNFKGKVRFVITGREYDYVDSNGFKEKNIYPRVSIIGRGINSKTGECLNFFTEGY